LRAPDPGHHMVQVYQDPAFLARTVGEYLATGLQGGEAALVIAVPGHSALFRDALRERGFDPDILLASGQLTMLDAEQTLAGFMVDGEPQWEPFRATIGGLIEHRRTRFPVVRAYGEMVNLLWQRGERGAALRLEGMWNSLTTSHRFSLLCAYYMDNLDVSAYGGPMECVCEAHTHFIPAPDYARFDKAVSEATAQVLDAKMSDMLLWLSKAHAPKTQMPDGQAVLLWATRNMPATAGKLLEAARRAGAHKDTADPAFPSSISPESPGAARPQPA
jgi:hypothetical protein